MKPVTTWRSLRLWHKTIPAKLVEVDRRAAADRHERALGHAYPRDRLAAGDLLRCAARHSPAVVAPPCHSPGQFRRADMAAAAVHWHSNGEGGVAPAGHQCLGPCGG